LLDSLF